MHFYETGLANEVHHRLQTILIICVSTKITHRNNRDQPNWIPQAPLDYSTTTIIFNVKLALQNDQITQIWCTSCIS